MLVIFVYPMFRFAFCRRIDGAK